LKSSANCGAPFSFIEGYFVVNCWVCAVAILAIVLADSGWQMLVTPKLFAFLVLISGIILLAIQGFILSRHGRIEPLQSFHFLAPAVLFGAAFLVSLVSVFVRKA
jgi:hypothetical protein